MNDRDVESVVDTGASTSAITLDCLRWLGLDHLIQPVRANYGNADGRVSTGMGKVPNLVLRLGDFATLIAPTVTTALNHDMLVGNGVLTRAHAVIDYSRGQLLLRVDPTYCQEIPISITQGTETCALLDDTLAGAVSTLPVIPSGRESQGGEAFPSDSPGSSTGATCGSTCCAGFADSDAEEEEVPLGAEGSPEEPAPGTTTPPSAAAEYLLLSSAVEDLEQGLPSALTPANTPELTAPELEGAAAENPLPGLAPSEQSAHLEVPTSSSAYMAGLAQALRRIGFNSTTDGLANLRQYVNNSNYLEEVEDGCSMEEEEVWAVADSDTTDSFSKDEGPPSLCSESEDDGDQDTGYSSEKGEQHAQHSPRGLATHPGSPDYPPPDLPRPLRPSHPPKNPQRCALTFWASRLPKTRLRRRPCQPSR